MNLGFENTMPNNAQQVAKTAKKREEYKTYQEYIDNEQIRQNDKMIELVMETNEMVKQLRDNTQKPTRVDYIIIILSSFALVFAIMQYLK